MRFLNFGKDKAGKPASTRARRAMFGAAVFLAAGAVFAFGATQAQAWHHGHPHDGGHTKWKSQQYYGHDKWKSQQYGGHTKWKSQQYSGHNKWKSQEYDDYHGPKKSQYQKKKYYHRKYGSWGSHPRCMHLGPFGVCEY